jgi:biotin transport system substrate-specific component
MPVTTLAQSIARPRLKASPRVMDIALVVAGSLVMVGLSHMSVRLPFTPVPVTGQTLGVLLVGTSLGVTRGAAAIALFLLYGVVGLPVYAGGASGLDTLLISSATGGYLWGFLAASLVCGYLAQRGWDRTIGSAIGAMVVGEIVIFTFGVAWLAQALGVSAEKAMELGLYPFVLGDLVKTMLAALILPAAWSLTKRS